MITLDTYIHRAAGMQLKSIYLETVGILIEDIKAVGTFAIYCN